MEKPTFVINSDQSVTIKCNAQFFSINAIIAANTKFEKEFSTRIQFSFFTSGASSYHQVTLIPRSSLNRDKVQEYVDEVTRYRG